MRIALGVVVAVLCGCGVAGPQGEQGPQGPAGPAGERGAAGPEGSSAPAPLWFDSVGNRIGPDPSQFAQGVRWPLDFETGQFALSTSPRVYESADCSGPAYAIDPPLPRVAFMVVGYSTPFVRADGAQAPRSAFGSVKNEAGVCNPSSGTQRMVRVDTLMMLTQPMPRFSGPLHLEVR
jgi:hypothetical protein